MAIFGSSNQSYLGVDIGSSSIKVVELKNEKGRPKLVTYGYMEQSSQILRSKTKESREKIAKDLKLVMSKARVSTKKVVAALPSYTVFSSVIALPEMPKKELEVAVNLEAKKFVPMPLEEMILDWKVLEELEEYGKFSSSDKKGEIKTKEKKQVKVLITAAPKDLVDKYIDIFKMAGLELVNLETESFALERSLVGSDKSSVLLIDIGSGATNLSVVMKSVPLINRSIDLGGGAITRQITENLNIDREVAEQVKRDFGLTGQDKASTDKIPHLIESMVDSIINEAVYVIDLYKAQTNVPLNKVILAGGSSWLPNLPDYLAKSLNKKVFLGDPWGRVIYPVELRPVLKEIGPSLAVAIGLAMREIV